MRLILLLIPLLLVACNQQHDNTTSTTSVPTSPIVAKLDNQNLRESDIDAEINALPESMRDIGTDPRARAAILQTLIRRKILSRQAIAMGIDKDPVVQQQIERARENILVQTMKDQELKSLTPPDEKTIEAYYEKHQADFTIPEQIHARHILVNSEDTAVQIYKQLRHGKDFAALAAQYSQDDGTKARGGDLNWFSRGTMVPAFEDAAFALQKPDDISKPVHTQFGWHIIQLLGRRPATVKSLDEAHDEIISILNQQAMDRWLSQATSHAHVQILRPDYIQPEPSADSDNPDDSGMP
ncbi:MAG TPA: peptidylprolyl isomerase [Mariprofundaceae bacterium]|nr:peptidylprolyl isomerase [Mariprofundaceae bacterium]